MKYLAHPVNLEALTGPQDALRVSVSLDDVPPGSTLSVWVARTPDVLSEATLVALARGDLNVATRRQRLDPALRQSGDLSGLRQLSDQVVTGIPATPVGVTPVRMTSGVTVTGMLFEPYYDMPLAAPGSPSWGTEFEATQERSDGPWFLAACALLATGAVTLARGGLNQDASQAHLAAVFLSSSDSAPLKEVADWLVRTIRSLRPVVDVRVASVLPPGTDKPMPLALVALTEVIQPDVLFAAYVTPGQARENPDGISAPDRREQVLSFNVRLVAMSDDPVLNVQVLAQAGDTLATLLNTKHYRQGRLPSGNEFNQAFVSNQAFGRTQTGWDDAVDLTWSCQMVKIAAF